MSQFSLGKQVFNEKAYSFEEFQKIGQKVAYRCSKCHAQNKVKLAIYQAGQPIESLFEPDLVIEKSDLLEKKAVRKNDFKGKQNLGELSLWFVAARFATSDCTNCEKRYIVVFGMGEIQMGREEVQISGIWELNATQQASSLDEQQPHVKVEHQGGPYKILQKVVSEKTPVNLTAVLAERYDPKNPMPPMNYPWLRPKSGVPFPETLYLICENHRYLKFDYLPWFNGFIISERLKDHFLEASSKAEASTEEYYQMIPLKSVNINGENNSLKRFFYLNFTSQFSIIDYEASEYVLNRGADEKFARQIGLGIVGFDKLTLNGIDHHKPFFKPRDSMFISGIVVTNELADELQRMGLVGFKISTIEEYALDYRKQHDINYVDPEKIERIRAKRNRKKKQ